MYGCVYAYVYIYIYIYIPEQAPFTAKGAIAALAAGAQSLGSTILSTIQSMKYRLYHKISIENIV